MVMACSGPARPAVRKPGAGAATAIFDIAHHGKPIGTETFAVEGSPEGEVLSSHVELPDYGIAFDALTSLGGNGEPLGYRLEGRPARREAQVMLEVDRPGHAFLDKSEEGQRTNVALVWSGPACLLDIHVVGHWAALARRWRGRPLKLSAIVPQAAAVSEVAIEAAPGAPPKTQALLATLRGAQVRLLLLADGTLAALDIPTAGLRAWRRGAVIEGWP
jgi:hypothetical protein